MSLRLAALWFDGSSPVVKVGVDSGPPLRAAGNLASNAPTPHVPDMAACRTGLQQCCSTSILKDNDTTGCTNVENPCKHSARMEDKTTSAVIHRCYLHCFRKSWPESHSRRFKTAFRAVLKCHSL